MAEDPTQLDVYLAYPVSASAYETRKLRCQTWQFVIGRQPAVMPLPGMRRSGSGEPATLALDFGMMGEDIILRGAISDFPASVAGEYELGTPLMRWPEIETIFRTSWRRFEPGVPPKKPCMLWFTNKAGEYFDFNVLLGALRLTRVAARDEWQYTATFHSVYWNWT